MATSPFERIKSENILSGYVNGIQAAVKDIQRALDLNTEQITGHQLSPVADQNNPEYHYKIYEGSKRNWLESPNPVIFRNGSQVETNEYELRAGYGLVIFKAKQSASDNITVNATRVIDSSQTLTDINNAIEQKGLPAGGTKDQILAKSSSADHETKWIDAPEGGSTEPGEDGKSILYDWDGTELGIKQEGQPSYEYVELQGEPGPPGEPGGQGPPGEGVPRGGSTGQVLAKQSGSDYDTDWIEAPTGGGNGGGVAEIPNGIFPYFLRNNSYISHQKRQYHVYNKAGEKNNDAHKPAFNVLVNSETLDAFPLPIAEKTSIKEAKIMLGGLTWYPVRVRIGVYSDDNGKPGSLLFQTSDVIVQPGEWGGESLNETLQPGLYWIARHDKSDSYWNGLNEISVEGIQEFDAVNLLRDLAEPAEYLTFYGGYRATGVTWTDDASMPQTYPSNGSIFSRDVYATPWLVVG